MAGPLIAAPATYTGEAAVASQSDGERAEAIKNALAKVVIERSGDAGILARDEVAKAVAKADQYVLQYRYRRDVQVDPASNAPIAQLILVAEFDRVAVDRMLGGLGLGPAEASAPANTAPVDHKVWISGIRSAEDYARGMGYLTRQAMVRQAWPLEARGDGVLVKVSVAGDFARWLEQLGLDAVLQVNSANPPVEGIDATLVLQP